RIAQARRRVLVNLAADARLKRIQTEVIHRTVVESLRQEGLPAETVVQGETAGYLPGVLGIKAVSPLVGVHAVRCRLRKRSDPAEQKIRHAKAGDITRKGEIAGHRRAGSLAVLVLERGIAERKRMRAAQSGHVVGKREVGGHEGSGRGRGGSDGEAGA